MKQKLLLIVCSLILMNNFNLKGQPLGWVCLKNNNGDTLKLGKAPGNLIKGTDGNLYFIGSYADNTLANHLIMWNDTTWTTVDSIGGSPIGYKVGGTLSIDRKGKIYSTCISDPVSGRWNMARWDDTAWSVVHGSGNDTLDANYVIYSQCVDTAGNLYVASLTPTPGSHDFIARFDGSKWMRIAPDTIVNSRTFTLCTDKLGNVYAAGWHSEGVNKYYVAKWDGAGWVKLNTGPNTFNGPVNKLYCDSLNNVYAAGSFTDINGFGYVAKWDGNSWTEVGTGSNALKANDDINALYCDSKGNIYAGGRFKNTKHLPYVAVFDGTSWSELGAAPYPLDIYINSTAISTICSDGKGNIYAGGSIYQVNNNGLNYIAKYGDATALSIDIINSRIGNIYIYPNPVSNQLHIQGAGEGAHIRILSILGRVVYNSVISSTEEIINTTTLQAGMYILNITDANGKVTTHRFVKE